MKSFYLSLALSAVLFAAGVALASAEVIVEPHGGAAGGICFGVNCGR